MRAISALLPACLWLATASVARCADDAVDPAALSLAKSFAKICLLAVPNFERVILEARIAGWKQVDGAARDKAFEWHAPPIRAAWALKGVDDLPIGVIIARESVDRVREMIATCAVEGPTVAPAGVPDALAAVLPLPAPDKPSVDHGVRLVVWKVHFGDRTIPVAMQADPSGKPDVILKALIPQSLPAEEP